MTTQITKNLLKFDEGRWLSYIEELCYNMTPNPSLDAISPELISQLFWIYNELNEAGKENRFLFTKCLLHFFRNIDPQPINTKLLYDIIYFIHEIRPIQHRKFLELLVRDKSFTHLNFGEDNLQLLLIKAYTNIEDCEELYLEEHLLNSNYEMFPYFVYLMMNYYSTLGHVDKALDNFSKVFKNKDENLSEGMCKEIYHALTDCIPQYIDLSRFLAYLINNNIEMNHTNPNLNIYIEGFVDDLKSDTDDIGLALFAEDVLKNQINNYLNEYYIIGGLAQSRYINNLILKYVQKFMPWVARETDFSSKTPISFEQIGEIVIQDYNLVSESIN